VNTDYSIGGVVVVALSTVPLPPAHPMVVVVVVVMVVVGHALHSQQQHPPLPATQPLIV